MASEVQICNLALSRIGEDGSIISLDPPEGSEHAAACAAFYQRALGSLLESHDWSFATVRMAPGKLATEDTHGWRAAYVLPPECARVISVQSLNDTTHYYAPENGHYEIESKEGQRALYTDCELPIVRYITATPNPGSFTSLFIDALAWRLASDLAGRIIKSKEGITVVNACMRNYQIALGEATRKDTKEKNQPAEHVPDWIKARGGFNGY